MAATASAAGSEPVDIAAEVAGPPHPDWADQLVGDRIVRFDRVERYLHWVNATLLLILLATGSVMYVPSLSGVVGRRLLVENIHVVSGLALPFPFVAVLVGRWRRGFVRDAQRLGRFLDDDWRWLRRPRRRPRDLRIGKFNAGQKLNAIFVAGALPVMLATGAMLEWPDRFSDSWRTGATFVHDLGFVALFLVTVAHIGKALAEPVLLRSMLWGSVPASWAERHRPRWHDEVVPPPAIEEPVDEPAPRGLDD